MSRNDLAKALGIKMGTPVFELRDLVQRGELHLFSSNYEVYQSISNRVMAILDELAPRLSVYRLTRHLQTSQGWPIPTAGEFRRGTRSSSVWACQLASA